MRKMKFILTMLLAKKGGAAALGGNDRVNLMSGQIDIDFAVFNIYQYDNANLTGHYTDPMTME